MPEDIQLLLDSSRLMTGLDRQLIEKISERASLVNLNKGDILFRQGDRATSVWVLLEGRVTENVSNEDGRELSLRSRGPGDFLGIVSALDWGQRRAEAVAEEDCRFFQLLRPHFLEILQSSPEFCFRIFSFFCYDLRQSTNAISETAFLSSDTRLATTLMNLFNNGNAVETAGEYPKLIITQSELSLKIGINRETANRHLRRWEEAGILELGRQQITLLDREALFNLSPRQEPQSTLINVETPLHLESGLTSFAERPLSNRTGESGYLAIGISDYSKALMADAEGTLQFLKSCRHIIDSAIRAVGGHIVWHTGDNILAEFECQKDAITAAIDILDCSETKSTDGVLGGADFFRLGIASAPSVDSQRAMTSSGLALASSVEALAEPGTAYVADDNYNPSDYPDDIEIESLGNVSLTSTSDPVILYRLGLTNRSTKSWTWQGPKYLWHRLRLYHYISSWRYRLSVLSLAVGIIFALAFFTLEIVQNEKLSVRPTSVIALLPFKSKNSDSDEFLAFGLADSLRFTLKELPLATILSASAIHDFAEGNHPLHKAQELLNTDYVITGKISHDKELTFVDIRLFNSKLGKTVWQDMIPVSDAKLFPATQKIVHEIARILTPQIDNAAQTLGRQQTQSMVAYEQFVIGKTLFEEWAVKQDYSNGAPALHAAVDQLEKAVRIDPNFVSAWTVLAEARLFVWGGMFDPSREVLADAVFAAADRADAVFAAADRALELDPNLADPYITKARFDLWHHWFKDYDPGEEKSVLKLLNMALEREPSARANMFMAVVYDRSLQFEKSFYHFERAYQLEPYSKDILYSWYDANDLRGHHKVANEALDRLASIIGEHEIRVALPRYLSSLKRGNNDQALVQFYKYPDRRIAKKRFSVVTALLDLGAIETARVLSETGTDGRLYIELARGNFDRAMKLKLALFEERKLEPKPIFHYLFLRRTIDVALWARKYEVADDLIAQLPVVYFSTAPQVASLYRHPSTRVNIAFILKHQKKTQEWKNLIEISEKHIRMSLEAGFRSPVMHYDLTRIHILRGELDKALEEMTLAVNKGYRKFWIRLDPILDPIRGRADFQALMARLDQENAAQLANLCELTNGIAGRPKYCDEDVAP